MKLDHNHLDQIVRRHTNFGSFDAMVAEYGRRQIEAACKLDLPSDKAHHRDIVALETALRDRAILVFIDNPDQLELGPITEPCPPTQPDNSIPEDPCESHSGILPANFC